MRKMVWADEPLYTVLSLMTVSQKETYAEAWSSTHDLALQTALANNPSFAAAQWKISIASTGHQQTGLRPNPVMVMDAGASPRNSHTASVKLSRQPKVCRSCHARIEATFESQCVAALELKHSSNELRTDVIEVFYGFKRAQQHLILTPTSQILVG